MDKFAEINAIYDQTRSLYRKLKPRLGYEFDHGFKILYGPPLNKPSALVIGFQPGGDRSHARPEEEAGPSATNEYLDEHWTLAHEMRRRFGRPWLESVVGLNVVFFRCPSTDRWKKLEPSLRLEIETFCREQTLRMLQLLHPKRALILGWDALEILGSRSFAERVANTPVVGRRRRRRLAQEGTLAGVPAVAIPHPSAAWKSPPVTDEDWDAITAVVKGP